MARRRKIPRSVEADILDRSRRRCAICYALNSDSAEKKGQIAHLDHDASNNDPDNLLFLCLEHHDQYDSTTSQSKNLSTAEVIRFRERLYRWVERNLPDEEVRKSAQRVTRPEVAEVQPVANPPVTPLSEELVSDLAADWGVSEKEIQSELERVKNLLKRVESADLPAGQRRLLEILITDDKGDGLPRRVVEVAAGYEYLSKEFYDEMTVLTHHGLASFEPEHDDNIYLSSHGTWMIVTLLCERQGAPMADILRNPDPDTIM